MKTHTTTTLQKLVLERMSPHRLPMSDRQITVWVRKLPGIYDEMLEIMTLVTFGMVPADIISRHMRQIARECTLLLDVLCHYPDFPERMQPLYQAVKTCLQEILLHQQERYEEYLDPRAKMPLLLYLEDAKQIEHRVPELVTAMTHYHADKTLQSLIVARMTGLLQKGSGTRLHLTYLEDMQEQIMKMCVGPKANITTPLKVLLLRLNFNTEGFMHYCREGIEQELVESYSVAAQYELLYAYHREFKRPAYGKKVDRLDPSLPKAPESMRAFIEEKLEILDRKVPAPAIPVMPFTGSLPELPGRLPLAISVDVLVYFFRLMLTAGVITGSKAALLQFLCRSVSTPGTAVNGISMQSIEAKYRQVVKGTAIAVKTILLKMQHIIDEEYA